MNRAELVSEVRNKVGLTKKGPKFVPGTALRDKTK